jgi:hypothetical protein
MQKRLEEQSPISSESSTGSIHDPPGYIKPSLQDMLLTDITAEELLLVANLLDVEYLSAANTFPGSFPATGRIHGPHKRLMVNIVCRREGKNTKPINIVFLVDTGSPFSYLSGKAMDALIGKAGSNIVQAMDVLLHSDKPILCHLSPIDKHFADVNVLGMDFIYKNGISLHLNCDKDKFELIA